MIIYFEKSSTGISIIPNPHDNSATLIDDAYYSSSATCTINHLDMYEPVEPEFTDGYSPMVLFPSEFIAFSGKIKQVWNSWYSRYMIWEPASLSFNKQNPIIKRLKHFSGFVCRNRGRQWDRKRRN